MYDYAMKSPTNFFNTPKSNLNINNINSLFNNKTCTNANTI